MSVHTYMPLWVAKHEWVRGIPHSTSHHFLLLTPKRSLTDLRGERRYEFATALAKPAKRYRLAGRYSGTAPAAELHTNTWRYTARCFTLPTAIIAFI